MWDVIVAALPALVQGALVTLEIAVISLPIAFLVGLLIALMSTSKLGFMRGISLSYVDFIRGTPLLVQIMIIYFGIPGALDFKVNPMVAAVVAISVNASAYMAEIFRAGIQSIDKGQMEAARSLGLTKWQSMRLVILPQAIRRMIPAFVNQLIVSIKDTSLLTVIGIRELMNSGEIIISTNYRVFEIWLLVAIFYFIMIQPLNLYSRKLERRMAK